MADEAKREPIVTPGGSIEPLDLAASGVASGNVPPSADELDAIEWSANYDENAGESLTSLDPQTVRRLVAQARLALLTPKGCDAASIGEATSSAVSSVCSSAAGLPSPGGATPARAGEDDVERVAEIVAVENGCCGKGTVQRCRRETCGCRKTAVAVLAAMLDRDPAGRVRGLLEAPLEPIARALAALEGDPDEQMISFEDRGDGELVRVSRARWKKPHLKRAEVAIRAAAASAPREAGREDGTECYRRALMVACGMLIAHEPGDSRAVSDEFVALSAIADGRDDKACWDIVNRAAPQEPQR